MGPAPKWLTTPPGVLELEDNWAIAHRFYVGTTHGDSWQGKQYLGMRRDLGDYVEESVVIRLPENDLVFQARSPEKTLTAEPASRRSIKVQRLCTDGTRQVPYQISSS